VARPNTALLFHVCNRDDRFDARLASRDSIVKTYIDVAIAMRSAITSDLTENGHAVARRAGDSLNMGCARQNVRFVSACVVVDDGDASDSGRWIEAAIPRRIRPPSHHAVTCGAGEGTTHIDVTSGASRRACRGARYGGRSRGIRSVMTSPACIAIVWIEHWSPCLRTQEATVASLRAWVRKVDAVNLGPRTADRATRNPIGEH